MKPLLLVACLSLAVWGPDARADSLGKQVPSPLALAVLQGAASDTAMARAAQATGAPDQVARSKGILSEVIERAERQAGQPNRAESPLSKLRRRYDLRMSAERLGELVIDADPARRLAELQKATATELSNDALLRLDDDIFWASLEAPSDQPVKEFTTDDGGTVQLTLDPDTRDGTVVVANDGLEDGLPFNLALPTRWVAARDPQASETDLQAEVDKSPAQDVETSGWSDDEDLFAPTEDGQGDDTALTDTSDREDEDLFAQEIAPPPAKADPDHNAKILTPEMRSTLQPQLNGLWEMSGFLRGTRETWFIATELGTDNRVQTPPENAPKDSAQLAQQLEELKAGGPAHQWQNLTTGEIVNQQRYKRLNVEDWDYLGERSAAEHEAEIARLTAELEAAQNSAAPKGVAQSLSGFDTLAGTGGAIRVRVLGACGYVMDSAFFDGLSVGVRHIPQKRCELNRSLPEQVKAQLEGVVRIPWTAMFRVIPDPRSDQLLLRGQSWGGQVHYDQFSLKVTGQTGPDPYSTPSGTRALQDENTLLSGSAMGAEDDQAL